MKIRIRTAGSKIIERDAEVIDKIDNYGLQYSIAIYSGNVYQVIDRDADGAIFGSQSVVTGCMAGSHA